MLLFLPIFHFRMHLCTNTLPLVRMCVCPTGAGMGGLLGYMFGRGTGGGGGYYRRPPHYGWNVGGGGSGWGSSPRSSWSSGGSHTTSGECHPTHSLPLHSAYSSWNQHLYIVTATACARPHPLLIRTGAPHWHMACSQLCVHSPLNSLEEALIVSDLISRNTCRFLQIWALSNTARFSLGKFDLLWPTYLLMECMYVCTHVPIVLHYHSTGMPRLCACLYAGRRSSCVTYNFMYFYMCFPFFHGYRVWGHKETLRVGWFAVFKKFMTVYVAFKLSSTHSVLSSVAHLCSHICTYTHAH